MKKILMIAQEQIPLYRLVLSLSKGMDYVHPSIADHQQRVAYIAVNVARRMGMDGEDVRNLFLAAAMHDCGLIRLEHRLAGLHFGRLEEVDWHGQAGYELLRDHPVFDRAAEIVRFHHVEWDEGRGEEFQGQKVPLASHVLHLADRIERAIDRSEPVLQQREEILKMAHDGAGRRFAPRCVEALCDVAEVEAFWLDCTCSSVDKVLMHLVEGPTISIGGELSQSVADLFAIIIDAASAWTAGHTIGVSVTAESLARRLGFSAAELGWVRLAGCLHDLGKLSIPGAILDKPARLTERERAIIRSHSYHTYRILEGLDTLNVIGAWAAYHHERLDGSGYPFHLKADQLSTGSRLMAVADTFTAIVENRPYRRGLPSIMAVKELRREVENGLLDGDIVNVMGKHYVEIDAARQVAQSQWFDKQDRLRRVMRRRSVSL